MNKYLQDGLCNLHYWLRYSVMRLGREEGTEIRVTLPTDRAFFELHERFCLDQRNMEVMSAAAMPRISYPDIREVAGHMNFQFTFMGLKVIVRSGERHAARETF